MTKDELIVKWGGDPTGDARWDYGDAQEAFCYLTGGQGAPGPIALQDVREVVFESAGEHDERDWIAVGYLTDGRAFLLVAGCDYTGWGCQAGGWSNIGPSLADILHPWVVPDDVRERIRGHLEILETADTPPNGVLAHNPSWHGDNMAYRNLLAEDKP